jgi:hypothetical protein
MGTHIKLPIWMAMKTTVEISDVLLRRARELAAREGTTLRAMIERGLHRAIQEADQDKRFKLRRAGFSGAGRQAEFRDAAWEQVRDAVYRDRGA